MTKQQSHHFVPQFLLRGWADQNGNLTAFRFIAARNEAAASRGNVRSACQIENLYALNTAGDGQRQIIEENYFRDNIDSPAALAYRKLLDQGAEALTYREREAWARLLSTLPARRPEIVRDAAAEYFRSGLNHSTEDYLVLKRPNDPDTLRAYVEKAAPGYLEDRAMLAVVNAMGKLSVLTRVAQMEWWTRRFPEREILIGDAPLLTRPEHPIRNAFNLDNPDLLIILPLAPTLVFFASPGKAQRSAVRKETASRLANLINVQSIRRCRTYVFGTPRSGLQPFVSKSFREIRQELALSAGGLRLST